VISDGVPVLGIEGKGRHLLPLDPARLEEALALLPEVARQAPGGRLAVERWADEPVAASEGADLLAAAGFSRGPRQMTYRAPVA
jgi:hypothetical protein